MAQRDRSDPGGMPTRQPLPLAFLVVGGACAVASLVIALVARSPWYAVLTGVLLVALWGWVALARARRPREPGSRR
jgi:Flp pilus assembly protein TadB